MFRKATLAACAVTALSVVSPALARGGGGGGHGGGGGFHGGGGGFHGGGFYGGGFRGAGLGFYGGYPYYGYGGYDDGCYLVRQPVRTPYGVRFRRVQVCS
jgi:hypothetical protein